MYALLVISFYFGVTNSFLYHQENVKGFFETGAKYYGYSVLLQKGPHSKLVVGSPLDQITGSIFINDIETGSKQTFTPYTSDDEIPKNWLFGAAMDGGETIGESVLVCQPRYTRYQKLANEDNYFANGGCYVFPNINDTTTNQEISPNSGINDQVWQLKYFLAFGQAGMSARYMDNYKEFVIGSPGILNWAGGAIKITEQEVLLPPQTRSIKYGQKSPRGKQKMRRSEKEYIEYKSELLIQLKNKKLKESDYGGYSVAYGELIKGSKYFIVGTPRSHDLRGSVVYIDPKENVAAGTLLGPDNIGSYFGSSLCVMDINGDGLDDLLVGAPMQKHKTYDEGFVYQYINGPKVDLLLLGTISPFKSGGRFGTAMSNLGKITLDNFDSVAISSPYENKGKGAIYIYVGTKEGLKLSQRIDAAPNAMGFGFGLSRAVDVDNNEANDLAVGAYISSSTYLYFARPVFYYEISINSNARLYSYQENIPFTINYCIHVVRTPSVMTNITIQFDNRLKNRQTSFKKQISGDFCEEIKATLYENVNDMDTPISIDISVHEEDCPKCPVSSPSFTKSRLYRIPFLYNCGDDQICTPNLVVSSNIVSSYTVGSDEDIALTVNIENKGEYAYICKLQVELPQDVAIKSASKECNNNNCVLSNPLQTADSKVFNLDFSNLVHIVKAVDFKVLIDCLNYTTSASSTVNLHYTSVVYVDGKQQDIIYKNKDTTAKVKSQFEYFIKNEGPSPLELYSFIIRIPTNLGGAKILDVYQPIINSRVDVSCTPSINYTIKEDDDNISNSKDSTGNVKAAQAFNFKSEEISCIENKIECMTIMCTARRFLKNLDIKITFPVAPNIDPIVQEYESTFIIVSELTYEMESQTRRVKSKITLRDNDEETYISYWAIILGTIIGFLVLGGLIFGLVKMGFFKRETYAKMKEEQLKEKYEEMTVLDPSAGQSTDELQ